MTTSRSRGQGVSSRGASWRVLLVAVLVAACAPAAVVAPEPSPVEQAQKLYEQGLRLRAEGRRREAAAVWETAVDLDPDHPDLLVALGGTLVTLGDCVRAREMLDRAAALRKADEHLWLERGRLHLRQHEYIDASGAFARALELAPEFYSAQLGLIEARARLGQCDEARRELSKLRGLRYSPRAHRLVRDCSPAGE